MDFLTLLIFGLGFFDLMDFWISQIFGFHRFSDFMDFWIWYFWTRIFGFDGLLDFTDFLISWIFGFGRFLFGFWNSLCPGRIDFTGIMITLETWKTFITVQLNHWRRRF